MNKNTQLFTEEQLDFIREMMNVGAGNAVTAMHQLLMCPVDLKIPKVHVLPVARVSSIIDNPTSLVACVKMGMVGDLGGAAFFIVPERHIKRLITLAEKVYPGLSQLPGENQEEDLSVIVEIGNILCGVYFTAIHDFCGLNLYHTVPVYTLDMIQSALDEALVKLSLQIQMAILIENKFVIKEDHINTLLLIIPQANSVKPLIDALGKAKKVYGSA
jgi:chemotaxis protein CheC